MKNNISFRLWGRYALFTDPVTKVGGEKCSYHVPTYEAIKGVLKSIYWKPTHDLVCRQGKGNEAAANANKRDQTAGLGRWNSLAIYTFLHDVEYQVAAHFEWNEHQPGLARDRIDGKHFSIVKDVEKGAAGHLPRHARLSGICGTLRVR